MSATDVPTGTPTPRPDASGVTPASPSARSAYERYNRSWRGFDRGYSDAAARAGLSDSALDVLWVIREQGEGVSQRDVCELSYLGKQTVNSSVHKLVDQGVLHLEPAASGRGRRILLTEAGRALMEDRVAPICQADFDAFAALPEHDREELVRIQQAYLDALTARVAALAAPDSADDAGAASAAGPTSTPAASHEPTQEC